jgi:hypothetical protein
MASLEYYNNWPTLRCAEISSLCAFYTVTIL